jgi:nucleotide-binding universal stress UspA family protein
MANNMSLESALEEERLSVMKMLEESGKTKKEKEGEEEGKKKEGEQRGRQRRPVSLLLNDEPVVDEDDYGDNKEDAESVREQRPRSKSDYGGVRSMDDPSDPFATKGQYYYSSDSLRSPTRDARKEMNLSLSERPKMPPRAHSSSSYLEDKDLPGENRRLSEHELSRLNDIYSDENRRLEKDSDDGEDDSDEDDDDDGGEIDDDSDESDTERRRASSIISEQEELARKENVPKSESPANVQKLKYKSLLDEDGGESDRKKSKAEYAAYKRRIIHPNTAFDTDMPADTPYTSDNEEIMDAKRAAQLDMEISPIHSNQRTRRMLRTLDRGKLDPLSDPNTPRLNSFIVSTDLSPEATHALEWTIGTVLRDGNVLYVVCAFDDDGSQTPTIQEEERLSAMEKMTNSVSKLLTKTRLQIHVIFEVMHCKSPKHMLTEIIDHVSPTLVILGSRGRSALKGVLLGSFSNYIVERSSVPVMVARRKLQKTKNKGLNVRLANNLRRTQLSDAKID